VLTHTKRPGVRQAGKKGQRRADWKGDLRQGNRGAGNGPGPLANVAASADDTNLVRRAGPWVSIANVLRPGPWANRLGELDGRAGR